jgi:arylsulfatase A-like enzyme
MNRREFVRNSVVASVATGLPAAASAEAPKRPNILYVFSDQHRACSMPGEPHSPVVAPTLDKFRHDNVEMQNCISNYPLCTPFRGIFMSGRWPQQTGMMGNGPKLKPTEYGLGQAFKDSGYHTGYVGKWHINGDENHFIPAGPLRFGFEDWHAWGQTNDHYHAPTWDQKTGAKEMSNGWGPTLMTNQALTFLDGQKGAEKPWMLVVSWNPPHPPFNPPADDASPYPADSKLELRPNVRFKQSDGTMPPWAPLKSPETLREAERGYYGGITGVDKEFARILKALEDNGQADNTIVVYSSDHGEMMGAQCRMSKIVPWEESCHVPFFVRIPGAKRGQAKVKELFSAIDIYPTLCGLAGIAVPKSCAGRDFSPMMRGDGHVEPYKGVMLMCESGGASVEENDVHTYRGVRTDTHTYAVSKDGRWCLYDNVADPYQMKNLVADESQKDLIHKLNGMIVEWQKTVGDTFPLEQTATKVSTYPS